MFIQLTYLKNWLKNLLTPETKSVTVDGVVHEEASPDVLSHRKKHDHTKITQAHVAFIQRSYKRFCEVNHFRKLNGERPFTQLVLRDFLNNDMGLDKSVTYYRRIWQGKWASEYIASLSKGTEFNFIGDFGSVNDRPDESPSLI